MGPAVMIIGIVLMVVIHEGGHFVAAKYLGMKATEAFFGFGPRLWSTTRGETEYGIKAVPLGGYVRIIGMNPLEEVAPEDEARTYRGKPFWQKSVVVLAGIASHFIVAFLLFYGVAVGYGRTEPTTTVADVSMFHVVGDVGDDAVPLLMESGDVLVSVDGVPLDELEQGALPGTVHEVVVERDGAPVALTTTDAVVPAPATLAGIEPGDRLVSIDGVPLDDWDEFVELVHDRPGEEVVIGVERDGVHLDLATTLAVATDTGAETGFLGVGPEPETVRPGPITAAGVAVGDLGLAITESVKGLGGLVTNFGAILGATVNDNPEVLETVRPISPIGLTRVASSVEIALVLLAWVNVFVGVLNLVPLYPLDGGHFAVAAYEKVRGRPADVRKLLPVAAAVFAFIVLLGMLGFYFDIVNPIELPG